MAGTNRLINETSKYLLQHAHNPVNWFPWCKEALNKAQNENKLLIISIGYSTCHWCHVMEKESFEDKEVAEIMNQNFISIKIDREERPDLDSVYMTAAQLITGRGGWPLNVIALPNGKPVYAATYFPKKGWISLLQQVLNIKLNNYNSLVMQAERLSRGIIETENIVSPINETDMDTNLRGSILDNILTRIDYQYGGFKRAPKFPLPNAFNFLLNELALKENSKLSAAIEITLKYLSQGGIFDHVEGGFFRYSTDEKWLVPHFEKMLYDNAQLLSLFSNYYRFTKKKQYLNIAGKTFDFLQKRLSSGFGPFYSAIDADSENTEGKYYTFDFSELENSINVRFDIFCDFYSVSRSGNWEGKIILTEKDLNSDFLNKHKITFNDFQKLKSEWNKQILLLKEKREHPLIDDKIITSWNSLAIIGLSDYYFASKNNIVKETLINAAEFLLANLIKEENEIYRIFVNGSSKISGMLDDYAFTISAFIKVYEVTHDEKWLLKAYSLTDYCNYNFFDKKLNIYNYTSHNNEEVITKPKEIIDNVIPSSNSQMALNLYFLGLYFCNDKYITHAKKMLNNVSGKLEKGAEFFSNWSSLFSILSGNITEIIASGPGSRETLDGIMSNFYPYLFIGRKDSDSNIPLLKNEQVLEELSISICKNKTCEPPVRTLNEAINLLSR